MSYLTTLLDEEDARAKRAVAKSYADCYAAKILRGAPDEARDDRGRWSAGGGAAGAKPAQRQPKPAAEHAMRSAVKVGALEQRWSEEHNEPMLAKAIGGVSLRDNEPVDVVVTKGGVVRAGVELKSIVTNVKSNPQLAMGANAQARKAQWMRENRADFHTVVFDDRAVFHSGDESKRQMYYKRGFGAFSLKSMQPVKDMAELRRMMAAPREELPDAAKPPANYPRIRRRT